MGSSVLKEPDKRESADTTLVFLETVLEHSNLHHVPKYNLYFIAEHTVSLLKWGSGEALCSNINPVSILTCLTAVVAGTGPLTLFLKGMVGLEVLKRNKRK